MRDFLALLRRFRKDEGGAFIAIFAVLGVVLIATAGAVVDYTSVEQARTRAQVALDAAALALQPSIYSQNETWLKSKAQAVLTERMNDARITATVLTLTKDTSVGEIYMTASVNVPMSFVALIGINTLTANIESKATRGSVNLEVALALDITGSMQGSKINDLIDSANELIDLVVQDTQTPTYTKLAIVPYSAAVNVGTYAAAARGAVRDYTDITGASWMVSGSNRTVSAINKASPARITTTVAHGYSTGDVVYFTGIAGGGFTTLNTSGGTTKRYTITVTSTTRFTLNGVSSSSWSGTYTASSGTVRKCQTNECEVVITSASNGLSENEQAYINNISGTSPGGVGVSSITALNNQIFTATSVASGSFVLEDTDGPDYSNSSGNSTYSSGGKSYCIASGCYYYYFQNANWGWNFWTISNCVTERVGANQYTDTAPSTTYVGRNYPTTGGGWWGGLGICPAQAFQPLTTNKTTLHALVNSLDADGSTAGQIGLAWAWYAVSPNFAYMFPSASQGAAYTTPNLVKVVILMTDGAFNTGFCNGVVSADYGVDGNDERINCNATNGDPFDQADSLCTAIKTAGVVVYTVAFDLGSDQDAIDLMAGCATDAAHAYAAENGTELQEAFQDIANNIASLRIAT